MLVLTGYNSTEFVTNDVGTRNGEDFVYGKEVIMQAMHDWNGGDVDDGEKRAIVVYPGM